MYPLHEETLSLVKEERRITGLVIENLQKIFDQRLFLRMGYSSMFDYCTKALGYSESCAYRRISAVKLVKEIPEIKEKLTSGALNLTNLTMMQSLSSSANMNVNEKKEILAKIENCSKRQAQEILANYFSEDEMSKNKSKESVRILSGDEAALHIRLPKETLKKLDRIKNLRAHKNPSVNYAELIEDMCEFVLKKIDPELMGITAKKVQPSKSSNPRYISKKLRAEIYKRDESCCVFIDKQTGNRCSSKHLLQIDHVKPISRGGLTELQNLQILCQAHHKYRDQYV